MGELGESEASFCAGIRSPRRSRTWLTAGLWMISFVTCREALGYCFLASYAICTALSTPQQYP